MTLALLLQKLPRVQEWIEQTLATHSGQARAVANYQIGRLGLYYPSALLASASVVEIDGPLPVPPLTEMGITGFEDFENLDPAGITYRSTYFVRRERARDEALHFHELVHVVQGEHLGPDRFVIAYALGHLLGGGYRTNPLEEMAYALEDHFKRNAPAVEVVGVVRAKLDEIVPALFVRAGLDFR